MSNPEKRNTPDVSVPNEGTVFVFCPLTDLAHEWINEHVQTEPWQRFGKRRLWLSIATLGD